MRYRFPSPLAFGALLLIPLAIDNLAQIAITPSDPLSVVFEAFKARQIVGIPDPHRNTATQALLLSLIRDRRFASVVDDIVVECGNALHQDVADRFVRGGDVDYDTLRKIWLDTTQAQPGCDTPQPEEVLRTVRAVNGSLPNDQRLRVLLGDPPIRWEEIKTKTDHRKWIEMRETYPADVVQREVVAKGRKALLVYGVGHLRRKNPQANFESTGIAASVVSLLEETHGAKVFNIGLSFDLPGDAASWPVPTVVVLRGTTLGAAPVAYDGPRVSVQDGKIAPVPRDQWRTLRMEDQYDALLYLGPRTSLDYAMVAPELCSDRQYVQMRSGRMALVEWKSDRLEDYCRN